MKAARTDWKHYRQPAMQAEPGRLETSVKTNMCCLRRALSVRYTLEGKCPVRQMGHKDLHRRLRCDGLVAPWIVEGAMNGAAFDIYVETQLAPLLQPGDVVILDNLNIHRTPHAAEALAARGAWLLFLPK